MESIPQEAKIEVKDTSKEFAKENIKPGIPKDILDKAKSIGANTKK